MKCSEIYVIHVNFVVLSIGANLQWCNDDQTIEFWLCSKRKDLSKRLKIKFEKYIFLALKFLISNVFHSISVTSFVTFPTTG